jgi:2-dehydropantoate 2-reductase
MRILIVGAGALGGYFGARLIEAKRDVTFLVRPKRAAQLAKTGLVVKSKLGDAHIANPPIVLAENIAAPFDLILVGCKAYDLEVTMESFAPAVGPDTAILPILNGMKHLGSLSQRFGAQHVLGGLCIISATLDDEGIVLHLNELQILVYGELDGTRSARIEAIEKTFAGVQGDLRSTTTIVQELWEKWVMIASLAGITSLMRAVIGDIERAGGAELAVALLGECAGIATSAGYPPRPAMLERGRANLTAEGSMLTASMMKDMERGAPIESDAIVGDLLARRVGLADERSLLQTVHTHLKAYEARRAREISSAASPSTDQKP